jgi:hypothetical protein
MGFCSVFLYSYHRPRTWPECFVQILTTLGIASVALLIFAFEGIICLFMAAPLALIIASFGGAIAYKIQSSRWWHGSELFCCVLLVIAVAQPIESSTAPAAPLLTVRTTIEINAPPERVWQNVVSFSELPPPNEWLFRLGIAYPRRATIFGVGPGAIRRCEFSTGAFIEPIEIWQAPSLLKFSVTSNPAPMEEWTPYTKVHPPHLDGFLESRGGQFRLTRLPGDRTRLEGTTWYRHRMWPVVYWQWWSDFIIHRIHLRVLTHIKHLSE